MAGPIAAQRQTTIRLISRHAGAGAGGGAGGGSTGGA
jgi:hypothetical protein